MPGVVEELVLGRAPIDVVVLLGSTVEHSRVSAGRELPVERELEVSELIARDDVVGAAFLGERAVHNVPGGGEGLLLVAAKRSGTASIEQWAPTRGALIRGHGARRRRFTCLHRAAPVRSAPDRD